MKAVQPTAKVTVKGFITERKVLELTNILKDRSFARESDVKIPTAPERSDW